MRFGFPALAFLAALAFPANAATVTSRVETPNSVMIEGVFGGATSDIFVGGFDARPHRVRFDYEGSASGELNLFTTYAINFVEYRPDGVREESFVTDCCDLLAAAFLDGTVFNDRYPLIFDATSGAGFVEFTFLRPDDIVTVSTSPYFEERISFWRDIDFTLFLYEEPDGGAFSLSVTAIPEPATWAMLILGFGAIGAAMRRRRSLQPARS